MRALIVASETTDVMRPWPFQPLSLEGHLEIAKRRRIGTTLPWYLDNGPLTPPGFGVEYPTIFASDDKLDPVATDVYVPKNVAVDAAYNLAQLLLHGAEGHNQRNHAPGVAAADMGRLDDLGRHFAHFSVVPRR